MTAIKAIKIKKETYKLLEDEIEKKEERYLLL